MFEMARIFQMFSTILLAVCVAVILSKNIAHNQVHRDRLQKLIDATLPSNENACGYMAMNTLYTECAQSILRSDDVNPNPFSGLHVVNAAKEFCHQRAAISTCVKDTMKDQGEVCSEQDFQEFDEYVAISEYFCQGNQIKPFVEAAYSDLGTHLSTSDNDQCLGIAEKRVAECLFRTLEMVTREGIVDKMQILKRAEKSMACELRGYSSHDQHCSVMQGLLAVTYVNRAIIFPPMLAVNVSYDLIELKRQADKMAE